MEEFEKNAIETATHKPACWYRYVDDTFVIWPHGQKRLVEFLEHLNGINKNIQFTVETEAEGHIPFLDIDIYRKDGSLGHKVYRKPTHKPIPTPEIPPPPSQQTLGPYIPDT